MLINKSYAHLVSDCEHGASSAQVSKTTKIEILLSSYLHLKQVVYKLKSVCIGEYVCLRGRKYEKLFYHKAYKYLKACHLRNSSRCRGKLFNSELSSSRVGRILWITQTSLKYSKPYVYSQLAYF